MQVLLYLYYLEHYFYQFGYYNFIFNLHYLKLHYWFYRKRIFRCFFNPQAQIPGHLRLCLDIYLILSSCELEIKRVLLNFLKLQHFHHQVLFFHGIFGKQQPLLYSFYVGIFIFFHFKRESLCRTVKAQIMTACQHEDIFWHATTFNTSLRFLLRIHTD